MASPYRTTPALTSSEPNTVTSFSVNKQAGTQSGDYILIYMFGSGTGAGVAISGFTTYQDTANGWDCLFIRKADGTEGSSFTITGISSHIASVIIATTAGGTLDPATPNIPSDGGAGQSIAVSSITLADAGDDLLWFASNQNGFSGNGYTITPPASFSITDISTSGNGNLYPWLILARSKSFGSGATGTQTGTISSASYYGGVMVGINGAGTPPVVAASSPSAYTLIGQAVNRAATY